MLATARRVAGDDERGIMATTKARRETRGDHAGLPSLLNVACPMPDAPQEIDPKPMPPEPPVHGECCERGCENCVWMYYYEALRSYEQACAQWRLRRFGTAEASGQ